LELAYPGEALERLSLGAPQPFTRDTEGSRRLLDGKRLGLTEAEAKLHAVTLELRERLERALERTVAERQIELRRGIAAGGGQEIDEGGIALLADWPVEARDGAERLPREP
jgi:hypothetical protein